MKIWIDAQLSPQIAVWITGNLGREAIAIRDLGLRDSEDLEYLMPHGLRMRSC